MRRTKRIAVTAIAACVAAVGVAPVAGAAGLFLLERPVPQRGTQPSPGLLEIEVGNITPATTGPITGRGAQVDLVLRPVIIP